MSNQDKIYFSKQEYNKLMQIINDNLKCICQVKNGPLYN